MMSVTGDWTAKWAARKLRASCYVAEVRVVGPGRLEVERHGLTSITIATLDVARLDHELLQTVLELPPEPDFVLNLRFNASLTAPAFHLSLEKQVPVGRMGDLAGALSMTNVREYVDRETKFRERGLEQHSRIADFTRLDLHRYRIERHALSPLTVVFLNDYELAAEAIRQARAEHGTFDVVVASNPNARITDSAMEVAEQLGCEVHKWGAFLSRLNREP